MPLSFGCSLINSRMHLFFSFCWYPLLTVKLRLGRSKDEINIFGWFKFNCRVMSSWVILSAVAVSAIIGILG